LLLEAEDLIEQGAVSMDVRTFVINIMHIFMLSSLSTPPG
jgi:hypothetical protein